MNLDFGKEICALSTVLYMFETHRHAHDTYSSETR